MPTISEHPAPAGGFPQTRWSLVLEAQNDDPEALAGLCGSYWYPLYAYARRKGKSVEDAEDLTQGFFHKLVSKDFFKTADQTCGRLRSFLLSSFKNYCAAEFRNRSRIKRGGKVAIVAIDALDAEARLAFERSDLRTPEDEFDRCWAQAILDGARAKLRADYEAAGKVDEFDAFEDQLEDGSSDRSYREIGAELGIEESKVRYIAFKLRQRFGKLVKEAVAETVVSPEDAAVEFEHLKQAFASPNR